MCNLTIYHNPKCSKSRQTLDLINKNNIKPQVILYLEEGFSYQDLKKIIKKLSILPRDLLRKSEKEYKEFNLDDVNLSDDELVYMMVRHPILIERPIVIKNNKAIIGRPPENVLKLM